ncbi:MarR family winged helix-turn-helix transcriptional regulator [Glaciimonas soli]|uniref:MarR family transcriptional regulator n=1 Tax=Glaciimonas soli TaxID=2590999 RepID=A0A843YX15_9BURK|nr:MarR family transcriptional regulator [Glaciimonas soli]MQR01841.1 MarR family transcriptional regulator [Glaciimonas soli]
MRKSNDKVNHSEKKSEDGVLDLIHTIMHQYRSQQFQVLRDGAHDITQMEYKVLSYFGHHPGATQSDLSRHSGRDKAQLARLIKGLRDRGLLTGEADETDRRNTRLSLSETGLLTQRTLQQQAKRLNAKAVQDMKADEQRELMTLLQRLKSNLDA